LVLDSGQGVYCPSRSSHGGHLLLHLTILVYSTCGACFLSIICCTCSAHPYHGCSSLGCICIYLYIYTYAYICTLIILCILRQGACSFTGGTVVAQRRAGTPGAAAVGEDRTRDARHDRAQLQVWYDTIHTLM